MCNGISAYCAEKRVLELYGGHSGKGHRPYWSFGSEIDRQTD